MFLPDTIVRSRRVLTPLGMRPGAIHIRQGRIIGVLPFDDVPAGCVVDDAGDAAILPHPIDAGSPEYRTPTPLVLVSSSEGLNALFQERRKGARITAAALMASLCVVTNDQERRDREFLWAALANGMIQLVVSGGSGSGDAGQLSLAALWKEARPRGYSLVQLATWTAHAPARIIGLMRKGRIDVGFDADLVVMTDEPALQRFYMRGQEIT